MSFITQHTKLIDCTPPSSAGEERYRELFIVEGDSASRAVARHRDSSFQAVLPMQGKPMNATKASRDAIRRNLWYRALMDALGCDWDAVVVNELRYDRVLFLFDPDADGIHCGALMLMFFDTFLRNLLDSRRVSLIKPPMFEIHARGYRDTLPAFTEEHLKKLRQSLSQKGIEHGFQRFRGLAGIPDQLLREACIDPLTRTAYLLRRQDAKAAREVFGSKEQRVSR